MQGTSAHSVEPETPAFGPLSTQPAASPAKKVGLTVQPAELSAVQSTAAKLQ